MRIQPERFPYRRIHITYICMLKQTNLETTSHLSPRLHTLISFLLYLSLGFVSKLIWERERRCGCLRAQLLTSLEWLGADLSTRGKVEPCCCSAAWVSCFSLKPQLDRGATQVYIVTATLRLRALSVHCTRRSRLYSLWCFIPTYTIIPPTDLSNVANTDWRENAPNF